MTRDRSVIALLSVFIWATHCGIAHAGGYTGELFAIAERRD